MYCICCKKDNVIPSRYDFHTNNSNMTEEDYIWKVESIKIDDPDAQKFYGGNEKYISTNSRMWEDGIANIIDAGYGSKHDGSKFVIAICDECISSNLEDGTLLYHGDYMNPDATFVKDEIEKSKKIYKRRKNLDGLV